MKKRFKFDSYLGEHDVTITFDFYPGRPARMYLRNGDPGYPEDPAECDIISVEVHGCDIAGEDHSDAWWEMVEQKCLDHAFEQMERTE